MIIGGLEGVQIHPLDAKPMGKIAISTDTTVNSLIQSIFSDSILGHPQKKTHSLKVENTSYVMSNEDAKAFFGITDEDIIRATPFTA